MFKWAVTGVQPNPDFTLTITFAGGRKRLFDCKTILNRPYAAPLKDIGFFMQARAGHQTVMWSEELDLCPEFLYKNSRRITRRMLRGR